MENNIKTEEKYLIDLYNEKYIDLNKKIKNNILERLTPEGASFFNALHSLMDNKLDKIINDYVATLNKTKQRAMPSGADKKFIWTLVNDKDNRTIEKSVQDFFDRSKKYEQYLSSNIDDRIKALEKVEKHEEIRNLGIVFNLMFDVRFYQCYEKKLKEYHESINKENEEKLKKQKEELDNLNDTNKKNQKEIAKLNDNIETLNNNIKSLKEVNKELDNKYKLKEEELINLVKENEELKEGVEELRNVKKTVIRVEDRENEENFINCVLNNAKNSSFYYSKNDIVNFHIALKTSQLVVLAGASGTGKTQLPFIYANTLNMSEENKDVLFVPITPSYTEPSDILGYFKPNLNKDIDGDGTYIESPTGLVSFLQEASKEENRNKLYMVIFDEMNLSQIEYWFSPFMSILERKEGDRKLVLYSNNVKCENSKIPSSIDIHNNVVFVGTINLDETTKDLSDRLLDRAIVVNLGKKTFLDYYHSINEESVNNEYKFDSSSFFTGQRNYDEYIIHMEENEVAFLDELSAFINSINKQKSISFRTIKVISNFLNNAKALDNYISRREAFDLIVKETIITKIKGSDNSIRKLLDSEEGIISILKEREDISDFKESIEALDKKKNELDNYGYTR